MKELSLNILDIAENSVHAGAEHIGIRVADEGSWRTLTITDDGCGMDPEFLARVIDPFATTRTTRPVGLGLPLLKLAAEQTGGTLNITSRRGEGHGTEVTATFDTSHIDCVPLGDLPSTIMTLVQGSTQIDFAVTLGLSGMPEEFTLDTAEIREVLEGVPLDSPEVLIFIRDSLREAMDPSAATETP